MGRLLRTSDSSGGKFLLFRVLRAFLFQTFVLTVEDSSQFGLLGLLQVSLSPSLVPSERTMIAFFARILMSRLRNLYNLMLVSDSESSILRLLLLVSGMGIEMKEFLGS
jgi:hypothetical protein